MKCVTPTQVSCEITIVTSRMTLPWDCTAQHRDILQKPTKEYRTLESRSVNLQHWAVEGQDITRNLQGTPFVIFIYSEFSVFLFNFPCFIFIYLCICDVGMSPHTQQGSQTHAHRKEWAYFPQSLTGLSHYDSSLLWNPHYVKQTWPKIGLMYSAVKLHKVLVSCIVVSESTRGSGDGTPVPH